MNLCNSLCIDDIDGLRLEGFQNCSLQPTFKRQRRRQQQQSSNLTDGDVLQVKDLNDLSQEERERALEDVHGVASDSTIPTDPAVIQQLLDEMEKKLNNVRSKKAYDMAAFLHPRYVKGRELRLKFLYGLRFDPAEAARRFVRFFAVKLQLFGPSLLGREVMLSDLSPEAISIVRTGCLQNFPNKVRDRSGRCVFYMNIPLMPAVGKPLALLQAFFYVAMAAVREISNEHLSRGTVAVFDAIGVTETPSNSLDVLVKSRDVGLGIPSMIAACHICFDSPRIQPAASLLQMLMPKAGRVRIRIFRGSTHIETLYYLNSFGIGQDIFPLDDNGDMDLEKLEVLLQSRIADENQLICDSPIVPTDIDVIAGRGKSYQSHSGNVAFLKLVEEYRSPHETANKDENKAIVEQIQQSILDRGGRFLKLSSDGLEWELLNAYESRRKIRNSFRWKKLDLSDVFE